MSSNGTNPNVTLEVLALNVTRFRKIPYGSEPVFRQPIARFVRRARNAKRSFSDTPLEDLTEGAVDGLVDAYDAEVSAAVKDTGEELIQQAFPAYKDRLLPFIGRIIGYHHHRAEDIYQETFIRINKHIQRFDLSKKFSAWIYTIAGNLAKNELRNRSRNPLVMMATLRGEPDTNERPWEYEDTSNRPDDLFRKRYLRTLVSEVVDDLPSHHQKIFRMREFEGLSYEEIADQTGIELGTVKSRLHRAREAFKGEIQPYLR